MTTTRKFFKTTFSVVVLSEGPWTGGTQVDEIHSAITERGLSGDIVETSSVELTPAEMAEAAITQGADPSFFGLSDDGEILDD